MNIPEKEKKEFLDELGVVLCKAGENKDSSLSTVLTTMTSLTVYIQKVYDAGAKVGFKAGLENSKLNLSKN